jgi:chromosomal replication initiation ATPase DnaA
MKTIYLNPIKLTYSLEPSPDYPLQVPLSYNADIVMRWVGDVVQQRTGLTLRQALSSSRRQEVVKAKRLLCYFARLGGLTYQQIAEHTGLNHATVIYHYTRAQELAEIYDDWKELTK